MLFRSRREVLLEWSKSSSDSPFRQQDLDEVERLIINEPIQQIPLCNGLYFLNLYKRMDVTMSRRYPPIIGVDVSGGYQQDSSAITVIDSRTTEVVADLNCNYISTNDLAKVIYELVMKYMPNAIVNIERTGVAYQQSQHTKQLVCFLVLIAMILGQEFYSPQRRWQHQA